MARGREASEWLRTAHMLALIANVNRDPRKSRAFRADDFNPYRTMNETTATGQPVSILKVFLRGGAGAAGGEGK
jgi:hypothetical protein